MISLIAIVAAVGCVSAAPSGHQISVPDYHPQLQNLGQHVDLPQIPTKVIRITKTVAIKVPVPYPVKVPYKVPYVVQVNKVQHVPVPKIVQIPQPYPVPVSHGGNSYEGSYGGNGYEGDQGSHYAQYPSHSEYSGGNDHAQESTYQLQAIAAQHSGLGGDYGYQQGGQQSLQNHQGAGVQEIQYQQDGGSYGHQ